MSEGAIIRDKHGVYGQGLRGNQHVQSTENSAGSLKLGAQRSIVRGSLTAPRQDVDTEQEFMNGLPQSDGMWNAR
jgi:hypothetical protein